jgi:hypothetical protein
MFRGLFGVAQWERQGNGREKSSGLGGARQAHHAIRTRFEGTFRTSSTIDSSLGAVLRVIQGCTEQDPLVTFWSFCMPDFFLWDYRTCFSLCGIADSVQLMSGSEVSMKSSVVNMRAEELRPLNSISLQNAVLCAECDVVSDSPHDHCLVCGSRSLFNMSRLLGGMLPSQRATLIDPATRPLTPPKRMLKFPRSPRTFNSRVRAKEQPDATQLRMFG